MFWCLGDPVGALTIHPNNPPTGLHRPPIGFHKVSGASTRPPVSFNRHPFADKRPPTLQHVSGVN